MRLFEISSFCITTSETFLIALQESLGGGVYGSVGASGAEGGERREGGKRGRRPGRKAQLDKQDMKAKLGRLGRSNLWYLSNNLLWTLKSETFNPVWAVLCGRVLMANVQYRLTPSGPDMPCHLMWSLWWSMWSMLCGYRCLWKSAISRAQVRCWSLLTTLSTH